MPQKRPTEPTPPPNLVVPRIEAQRKIKTQIEKGCAIRDEVINSDADLQKCRAERTKWSMYNIELLTRLFDNDSIAKEYSRGVGGIVPHGAMLGWFVNEFRKSMDVSITRMEAILDRLELIPEALGVPTSSVASDQVPPPPGSDVFVVHGRDKAAKESVARFIEKLELRPIVLHEQPNEGRTIIEKFEDYSDVRFAIVILTPDDIGGPRNIPKEQKPRARQNVIFELGYFVGKIGRGRVCALYKEDVEMPSDYDGVLYVAMDPNDAWRLKLAKEMKQAGLAVDLNKVL
jgi:predicted nucleotide-binding protein